MRRVLALAWLTCLGLWRTRVIWLLLVLLLGMPLILAWVLQGDGTPVGELRLWWQYSLGWSSGLLSMAALTMGAAAISLEVADRNLILLRIKPVATLQVLLGKWLGLVSVLGCALLLGMIFLWVGLHYHAGRVVGSESRRLLQREFFTVNHSLQPAPLPAPGGTPEDVSQGVTVAPGATGSWKVTLPTSLRADEPTLLYFEFLASVADPAAEFEGLWLFAQDGGREELRFASTARSGRSSRHELPAGWASPGAELVMTYQHNSLDHGVSLLFPRAGGVELSVPAGGFAGNLLRAGVMIMARLLFLAALGIAAGAAFSFPVALFAAAAAPVMELLNRLRADASLWTVWLFGDNRDDWTARLLDYLVMSASGLVSLLLPKLARFDPRGSVTAGQMIAWPVAGEAVVVCGLYAAALLGLGAWVLARRQLGAVDS
ncbi:MAG: hypothetical protein LC725_06715 [Lentisphaerae bacterium]|nr:hypothetical protein [Lentisphaerota bacterium]